MLSRFRTMQDYNCFSRCFQIFIVNCFYYTGTFSLLVMFFFFFKIAIISGTKIFCDLKNFYFISFKRNIFILLIMIILIFYRIFTNIFLIARMLFKYVIPVYKTNNPSNTCINILQDFYILPLRFV